GPRPGVVSGARPRLSGPGVGRLRVRRLPRGSRLALLPRTTRRRSPMTTDQRGTTGRGPGEGRSPLPGQHDEASAESSAGRSTSTRDPHERSSAGQGAAPTPRSPDKGGDRRGARRQARGHRLTVRLDDEEAGQVADLAERYGIPGSGVLRAGVAVLAGAPVPQPPNVDLLAVRREVNAL